ncbi:uncharacterized protein N7477_003748 [Penicillium maclennaniae]|uniref:uncharacterized protein n=1 Tax=Penicillium maclennaniae TaxID=1343394 RepID=UPI00254054A1|nr:uncharacterized protein N7477_003748 [Penicillium maclennaniae]KAJ5678115.1 hypothetical protein N7477_003748 [Penicillium maclennaniae]
MQHGSPPLQKLKVDRAARPSAWERFCSQFHMRPPEDDEPQSWWFASTAIPLVAAAAGPLANVMSIVALIMPWRSHITSYTDGPAGNLIQNGYPDPHWVTAMNAVSLFCGVVGNVFLLFNFTTTIRYIIALPVTIILWFLATGMLCGLTASLSIYSPPIAPDHVYSQGYWSAVIAASLYFILASLLMINMLGYFLGRYPQHFSLTDDQRTLILQMTAFMVWLLVGAAIFQKVLGISFADALYFSDITVLTLGFGDVVPATSVGRGLVWPYAVIGIIQLGLVVGSIHRFAKEVHYDNVIRKHIEHKRQSTYEQTITRQELDDAREEAHEQGIELVLPPLTHPRHHPRQPIRNTIHALANNPIQYETMRFRRWNDLVISIVAFGIVWSCGAVVFWKLENEMDYFESLHFCFCSLLTIGYGDFTPKSNAGRPFFVAWSLIAIPTMTMLISQMSDTIVAGVKHSTDKFADYFVLPQSESYRSFFAHFPCIMRMLQRREENRRVKLGFPIGAQVGDVAEPEDGPSSAQDAEKTAPLAPRRRSTEERPTRTIEELAREPNPSPFELAQQLAFAIRRTTQDVREGKRKRYKYEEWVEFTRLIQFTDPRSGPTSSGAAKNRIGDGSLSVDTDKFGVLNWDWIGENSPMLAHMTEPEWILDRLCESLIRYVCTQEQARAAVGGQIDDLSEEPTLKKERDLGIDES